MGIFSIDHSLDAENEIKNTYGEKRGDFWVAENEVLKQYSSLLDCQKYDAECQAIQEAENTYSTIKTNLSNVNRFLKNIKSVLEAVRSSLKNNMTNTNNFNDVDGKLETLTGNIDANNTKFDTILRDLETNIAQMAADKKSREELYNEIYGKIKEAVKSCRKKYKIANKYFDDNEEILTNDSTNMYYRVNYSSNEYEQAVFDYVDLKEGVENG